MVKKLKGSSKIKTAKRPMTTRDKNKTAQKLGLLTPHNRRMVSIRMSNEMIGILEDLLAHYRAEIYHRLSKTDVMEAALLHASKMNKEEFVNMCADYGMKKAK